MKEIDFLPEWYKSGRRRQVSYRTQYIAIGGVFVVMVVWSFIATHSISQAKARYAQMATNQAQAEKVSAELAELENEMRVLRKKAGSIEEIDSRIDVAGVLAEMSFLIDEKIVLRKVEFIAEKFLDEQDVKSSPAAVVRAVQANLGNKKELPLGNVRFKVVIAGVAAGASDVATLMCKLEDSPYFCQVVLAFSRGDAEIGIEGASSSYAETDVVEGTVKSKDRVSESGVRGKIQVNEFEINCYLANYREL
jgi:Tfp pilus assembly protein PilN